MALQKLGVDDWLSLADGWLIGELAFLAKD